MLILTWLVKLVGKIGLTREIELVSTQVLIGGLQACWVNLECSVSTSVILASSAALQLVEV